MDAEALRGGTREDRSRILELHDAYLRANATYDRAALAPLWSAAPDATFFNLNGHTYHGRDHWLRLWEYYGSNVASTYWTPFGLGGAIGADQAVVWCERRTRRRWQGVQPPPQDLHYDESEFVSRSTMVFRKEDGAWRVIHAHFSPAAETPRPGGV